MNNWCSCNRLMKAEEKAAKWDAIVRCGECVYFCESCGTCNYRYDRPHATCSEYFCSQGERRDA